ncbi:MalM family protein [Endozoicomonas lisbonensis]
MKLLVRGLTFALIAVVIATGYGCATFQADEQEGGLPDANQGKTFHSIADITCQPLVLMPGKGRARVVINEFTARLEQPSGLTPVLAYQIPEHGMHKIAIDSFVIHHSRFGDGGQGDNELFYPEIALLDQNNVLISKVDPGHIGYKKPGFTTEEGVGTSFTIDNRGAMPDKPACLLIYTTDALRKGTTPLINEEKEYAKVRGVVPPPIPDPVARHGNAGHLMISVKSDGLMPASRPAVVLAAASHQVVHKPARPASPVLDQRTREIRNHYVDGIKNALDQGNVSAALDQRTELKSITADAEYYFLNNYGKPKAVIQSVHGDAGGSFADKARNVYKERMSDYFKQGKGSAALQLLDEVKSLQMDVDQLFDR